MAAVSDLDIGKDICKILHLDPGKVRDITIFVKTGDAVMVQVDMYLQDREVNPLLKALKDYKGDGEDKVKDDTDGETLIHFNQ